MAAVTAVASAALHRATFSETTGCPEPGTYHATPTQSRAASRALEDEPHKVWSHVADDSFPAGPPSSGTP